MVMIWLVFLQLDLCSIPPTASQPNVEIINTIVLSLVGNSPAAEFMCRRFGTLCFIFVLGVSTTPMKMKQCSETSAHKIQTPGNPPKERIQHSEYGGSLKPIIIIIISILCQMITWRREYLCIAYFWHRAPYSVEWLAG